MVIKINKGTGFNTVLNIDGNKINQGTGFNTVLNISGNKINQGTGFTTVFNISGKKINKGSGFNTLYNSSENLNNKQLVAVLYALGEIKVKGASKKSGKGGCFIATATMGDYDHPLVKELREFRDQYLLERSWGKKFTKYYYKFGPYPAKVISNSNLLKKVSYVFIVKPLSFVARKIMEQKK